MHSFNQASMELLGYDISSRIQCISLSQLIVVKFRQGSANAPVKEPEECTGGFQLWFTTIAQTIQVGFPSVLGYPLSFPAD